MIENPAKYIALGGLLGFCALIFAELGAVIVILGKILEAVQQCGS